MASSRVDLNRAIPDRTCTDDVPGPLAAELDFLAGRTQRWLDPDPSVHPAVRARALVVAGRSCEAVTTLVDLVGAEWSPQGVVAATWSASRVPVPELADPLDSHITRGDAAFWTQDDTPLCTTEALLGLRAVASGDLQRAEEAFEAAVRGGDRRAPVWGALARLELARVQLTMSQTTGADCAQSRAAAIRNLGAARTFFTSAGYEHLAGVTAGLLELCGATEPDPRGRPAPATGLHCDYRTVAAAAPLLGILSPGVGSPRRPWTVGFGVQPLRTAAPRKGLTALRHLVANRHRQVPAVELAAVLDRSPHARPGAPAPATEMPEGLLVQLEDHRDGAIDDPRELSASLRKLVMDDRQRSRISKLLNRTITSLAGDHRGLAAHLDSHVSTGYLCSYSAAPQLRWIL